MNYKLKSVNVTVLNGDPLSPASEFSSKLIEYCEHLMKRNCEVNLFHLIQYDIQHCSGCWSCWWKTPGKCAVRDNADQILRSVIHSDMLIFASQLVAGFTSSELKKITDRLIVLIHPYTAIRNGEFHHQKRYSEYPDFSVIVEKEADTDEEDLKITKKIYDRLAINFHSNNRFLYCFDHKTPEEIANETCYADWLTTPKKQ